MQTFQVHRLVIRSIGIRKKLFIITAQNIFIVVITMNGFSMYKTVIYRIRIFTLCVFFVNNNSLMRNDKQEKV